MKNEENERIQRRNKMKTKVSRPENQVSPLFIVENTQKTVIFLVIKCYSELSMVRSSHYLRTTIVILD